MTGRDLRQIVLVFLIAFLAAGYFHSQDDVNSNSRLALVKAMVEQHRFEIDSYHAGALLTFDQAFYNGHYYTDKAIGSSLLGAEFYSLLYRLRGGADNALHLQAFKIVVTLFTVSLLCAFLAPFLYLFARQVSGSERYALLIAAAICIGTPFYVYSSAYYGHSLAGVFLFVSFYIWFAMKTAGAISPFKAFCSGCLLGYAVITEYPTAIIAFAIGFYILYVMFAHRRALDARLYVALLLGGLIPASAVLLYNHVVYGNPLAVGYGFETVGAFRVGQSTGFMGIGVPNLGVLFYTTFHTTMGVFWQSPVLLLAFPGWVMMWRSRTSRAEAIVSAAVVLLYFVILSGYYAWWGGLAFTPRHIVPALPFFGIPLAFLAARLRPAALVLAAVSILQMLIVDSARYDGLLSITIAYSQGRVYRMFQNSTIYNVYLPNFLAGRLTTNLAERTLGLMGCASLIPLVLIEAALVAAFFFATRQRGQQPIGQTSSQEIVS